VIFFAPIAVVDVVVVIARFGPAGFEEIGILQEGGGGHETATGVAPHADAREIDVGMDGREALGDDHFVGEAIIAEIAVAEGVVPLVTLGAAAAGADFDDDEAELRERDVGTLRSESLVNTFGLRAGIDEFDERIFARGIEVEGLVEDAVEIGDAVFGFDSENFGKFEAGFEKLRDVGGFEVEELGTLRVEEDGFRDGVDAGVGVGEKFAVVWGAEGVGEIAGA
jgi:hypothetical protein